MSRHAGVAVPLFSIPSRGAWGIGEIPDLGVLSAWMASAGFSRVMLLPIVTMGADQTSPYSASSAMAIDPLYVAVGDLEDFVLAGGIAALSETTRFDLELAQGAHRVQYAAIRRAKREALELAFARFMLAEWAQLTPRGSELARYAAHERWWLDDYALFQAIAEQQAGSWRDWPAPIRDRDPKALDETRRRLSRRVLFHQYVQWIAEGQWQRARASAAAQGVTIIGDLPFVVDLHSADVWARADEFLLDVSLGVPPDAFSATGQDWGLPVYRWDVIAGRGFSWIHQRARRMAALFGAFRIDHVIGFYRTYGRPKQGEPFFIPRDEGSQLALGETVLRIFRESGAGVIAEDLGTVPGFLRPSLERLGVPGCKVLRWEREWDANGQPFVDPAMYPPLSAALTGTHDTHTLADWWDHAGYDERRAFLDLPAMRSLGITHLAQPWSAELRDAILTTAYESGSIEVIVPIQDVFGWRDRINVPGTVTEDNWTWRLPWPVDELAAVPAAVERAEYCRALATATGRT
jgi:4-alpha-glucanotransferase